MRLLLAEDEKELSAILVTMLKKNNYSVDAVYNGQDAVDYLDTELYDAAILDIMMPVKDGLTALREIRAKGNNVPVLLLTAKSQLDDRVDGLDAGADDYLPKPFEMKELLARLRAITRRTNTQQKTSVLTYKNVSLDCTTYELSTPDGSVKLANKDFQMMEMFMANPSQVISSERFMDKIWGYDSEASINVVWVYISSLRKKLASLNADMKIKAKRNSGYYLE